jgi:hypothetical protein
VAIALPLIHTHYNLLPQAVRILSVLYLHRLSPGNGFQRRSSLSFRVCHYWPATASQLTKLETYPAYSTSSRTVQNILVHLPTILLLLRHVAVARTEQRTPLPSYTLVHVRNLLRPLPSNGLCLQSYYLAMGLYTILRLFKGGHNFLLSGLCKFKNEDQCINVTDTSRLNARDDTGILHINLSYIIFNYLPQFILVTREISHSTGASSIYARCTFSWLSPYHSLHTVN